MKLPKKINPCPVIEAVFEIRFSSSIPGDAVFGSVYSAFKASYPDLVKLPILQMPETVRDNDPNLKYLPHFRLGAGNYFLQVGPKVLSVAISGTENPYSGWGEFYPKIQELISAVYRMNIVESIERVGLRFVNLLPSEASSNFNIELKVADKTINNSKLNVLVEKVESELTCKYRVVGDSEINIGTVSKKGTIIDIDISSVCNSEMNSSKILKIAKSGRKIAKTQFFEIIGDYVENLNPEYV